MTVFTLTGATQNFSSGRKKEPAPVPSSESPIESAPEPEPAPIPAQVPEPIPDPIPEPVVPDLVLVPSAVLPVDPVPSVLPEDPVPPLGPVAPVMEVPATEAVSPPIPAPVPALAETVWHDGEHNHPAGKGLHYHDIPLEKPASISHNQMITQQVWLDPQNPPKGIALQFLLATGELVGVYWEGEEEVFNPEKGEELWYYGPLPEYGTWATQNVLVEDLGLEEEQITGLRFSTHSGRALWNRTVLTEAPAIEEAEDVLNRPVEVRPGFGGDQSVSSE